MSKEEMGRFIDELKTNKKVQESLLAENPETLEDLARVSGGVASSLGYKVTEDEILNYYNDVQNRSNSVASSIEASDVDVDSRARRKAGCGAVQVLLNDGGNN